ncbi:hypothetical protein ES703_116131 [subsurface metagenome]
MSFMGQEKEPFPADGVVVVLHRVCHSLEAGDQSLELQPVIDMELNI